MTKRLGTFVLLFLCLIVSHTCLGATRRLALIVGNNEGSDTKPFLRYAEQDAKNFYNTLLQVG
jgi:hypothetical protein